MRHTIMKLCWNKPFFNISPRSKKENRTHYLFQMSRCYTFLISHMQLFFYHTIAANSTQIEYYLTLCTKCCRFAFKIACSIGNMRLYQIQQRLVKGLWMPIEKNLVGSKARLIGSHEIRWMEIYFSTQCDIMPTTGRLQCEVYQAYKDDMCSETCPSLHINNLKNCSPPIDHVLLEYPILVNSLNLFIYKGNLQIECTILPLLNANMFAHISSSMVVCQLASVPPPHNSPACVFPPPLSCTHNDVPCSHCTHTTWQGFYGR